MLRTRVVGVVLGLAMVAGCSTQRPLHKVLESGERAVTTGNHELAAKEFGEYVDRRPEAVDVRYQLARSQMATGQPRAAIENLNIALDVSPLNDEYLDALAEAMWSAGEREGLTALLARATAERGRVSDYVRQANYAVKLGNADEALQSLLTAAKLDGGRSARPQIALANFYGAFGDKAKQVKRLRMAYFLTPEDPWLLAQIRSLGEIPGPTFAMRPEEWTVAEVRESK